jgi:geranylgeranyl diphosphate synthase, type II
MQALPSNVVEQSADAGSAYLELCRKLALDEIDAIIREGTCGDRTAYELMRDYPMRPGKGLRPALCIAACEALGGDRDEILPSAAVLELYHNAFLIHDDIEDGSLERRGRPALHRSHGIPAALNCGDGLLALTLRPLLRNTDLLGLGRALRILEIYAATVTDSFEGQSIELRWIEEGAWDLADADYEQMVRKKTCHYSFVAPVQVAAAVARAGQELEELLVSFAEELGIAFQIRDDVLNLERERTSYGKEPHGDLWEGKRTLMLLHALRTARPEERERMLAILRKPRPFPGDRERNDGDGAKTEGDIRFLLSLIERSGAIDHARDVALRRASSADATLQRLSARLPPTRHLHFLGWLTDYVVGREW